MSKRDQMTDLNAGSLAAQLEALEMQDTELTTHAAHRYLRYLSIPYDVRLKILGMYIHMDIPPDEERVAAAWAAFAKPRKMALHDAITTIGMLGHLHGNVALDDSRSDDQAMTPFGVGDALRYSMTKYLNGTLDDYQPRLINR